ncbi:MULTISPECIES: hypothetical protein [Streptomyces]|uniref:hypothetical protein n=1 Tax=Streptomyces TaxID=1883 RepID=UPI0020CA385B|nr:hypothetical protein [Streptomyces odorifer]
MATTAARQPTELRLASSPTPLTGGWPGWSMRQVWRVKRLPAMRWRVPRGLLAASRTS